MPNQWKVGADVLSVTNRPNDPALAARVLSANEQKRYQKLEGKAQKDFLFGRWCAKEAIFKATGAKVPFHQIDIASERDGAPLVNGVSDYLISLSISHDGPVVFAVAVATAKRAKPKAQGKRAASAGTSRSKSEKPSHKTKRGR